MIKPDDDMTVPAPIRQKATGFQKALALFAILGVIGLGTCGFAQVERNFGVAEVLGAALIVISLAGLVITAAAMAIASILKATSKTPEE